MTECKTGLRLVAALLAFAAFGCTSPDGESVSATASAASESASAPYRLISVGGQPLQARSEARLACREVPFASWYILDPGQWRNTDSVFTGCGESGREAEAVATIGAGTYRLRGDTIDLFVSDTMIGERGLVGRGLLRGDTLSLWGSDLDGGEYVYVRRGSERD